MPSITITLIDRGQGKVSVHTDAVRPHIGASVTQAQGLAMELLGTSYKRGAEVIYSTDPAPAVALLRELLSPEGFGFAVTAEVRDRAREVLGMPRVETLMRRGSVR